MVEIFQVYLETVEQQIRWKRARSLVSKELAQHLSDQTEAFVAEGDDWECAEMRAVKEMGDPTDVGVALDRVHRPKPQWGLLILTLAIALTGGVLRVWLTGGSIHEAVSPVRTATALLAGSACLVGMYLLDYTWLLRHAAGICAAAFGLGVVSLLVSPRVNCASYYTRYIVLFYPVIYALWLYSCRKKGWSGFLLAILGGVPLAAVGCAAPYFFGILQLLLVGAALFCAAAGMDWFGLGRGRTLAAAGLAVGLGVGVIGWKILWEGLFAHRLTIFLHPEQDPLGLGYQAMEIRQVLSAARFWGTGNWESSLYAYEELMPNWDQDVFLTTVIYKLGWLPFLVLMGLLGTLLIWLLQKTVKQRCQSGKLLALAVLASLALQALGSIALNLGYVLCSVSMPLMVGNLAVVADLALVGLGLSIFREESIAREEPAGEPRRRIRVEIGNEVQNGKRIFGVSLILSESETKTVKQASHI